MLKLSHFIIYNLLYSLVSSSDETNKHENKICEQVNIVTSSNDLPPMSFSFKAVCDNLVYEFNFLRNDNDYVNVYIKDDKGLRKMDNEKKDQYLYKDNSNNATAKLIVTRNIYERNLSFNNAYKVIITIQNGLIIKSIKNENSLDNQYILINKNIQKRNKFLRLTLSNTPQNYYIEYLLILDSSVFEKYRNLYSNLSDVEVISKIKTMYSYFVKSIDSKFQNSFETDPIMRVNVILTNIIIYQNPIDTPWTNTQFVGIPGVPLYIGREPIIAANATAILTKTMNNRTLPFKYDYALAITKKDLWDSDSRKSYKTRSALISFSSAAGICTNNKYSIIEDQGFFDINTAARALGYNIGASSDETGTSVSCLASANYIMTPVYGIYSNATNLNYFSQCSISTIKSRIQTKLSTCLKNFPEQLDNSLDVIDLPGSIYDINHQCRLLFGQNSSYSKCYIDNDPICDTLYCFDPESDMCFAYQGIGAIDGTSCGNGNICLKSLCVDPKTQL